MSGRGLGWRKDYADHRDALSTPRYYGTHPPEHASLEAYCGEVYDQGATNSCVGNALAKALEIGDRMDGREPQVDSRLFHYYNARAEHGDEHFDLGTYIRSAIKAAIVFGRPPETAWPFVPEPAVVNRRPRFSAYRAGFDRRGPAGYFRIPTGRDIRDVRQAISEGKPVIFGAPVSREFTENEGEHTIDVDPDEQTPGGHAMLVVGYEKKRLRVLSSWGTGWRDNGYVWVTNRWFAQLASDIWAIDSQP